MNSHNESQTTERLRRRHEPLWWVLSQRRMRPAPVFKLGQPNATAVRIIERRWERKRKELRL